MHLYNKQFEKINITKSFNHQRNYLDDHPNKKIYSTRSKNLNKNLHFCFPKNNQTEPKKCKFLIMSSLHAHAFSTKFRVILVCLISWTKQRKNFFLSQTTYHRLIIHQLNKQTERPLYCELCRQFLHEKGRYTWEFK